MFRLPANSVICLAAVLLSSLTAVALCLLLVISAPSGHMSVRHKSGIEAPVVINTALPTEGTSQREQKFLECRYLTPKSPKDEKMKILYRECLRRIAFDGDLPPEHRQ